jgi:hypothetical protein
MFDPEKFLLLMRGKNEKKVLKLVEDKWFQFRVGGDKEKKKMRGVGLSMQNATTFGIMTLGKMAFSVMTLGIKTFGIQTPSLGTLGIKTICIMALGIMTFGVMAL